MKEISFPAPQRMLPVCTASVLVLGFLDYVTGYEFNFFAFYFLPIAAAAWVIGARKGYAVSLLSAVVWYTADRYSGHPYSHPVFAVWNAGIRLLSFLIIAYSVSRIQTLLTEERKISEELRNALTQVKTLSGLLPICASCKKIRDDKGYWQQIEKYITERSDARFTHSLCKECADKCLREAGLEPESTQARTEPRN